MFFLAVAVLVYILAANHTASVFHFWKNINHNVANMDNGWNLILVNRDNYIPDDYEIELTELSNGEKVDSRIYPELQEIITERFNIVFVG